MNDGDNKTETTRGHWLEHHEHSSSSVATLTKTEPARGPTCSYRHGRGDVPAKTASDLAGSLASSGIMQRTCVRTYKYT